VNSRYLLSTNNGYGTQYLQAYDALRRLVTGKLELPSLWFGLAYEPDNKLVVASDGKSSVYLVPFHDGAFGKPQSLEISGCKLTAGLVVRDHETAIVACNQNHQIVEFDLRNGSVRARLRVGEFLLHKQPLYPWRAEHFPLAGFSQNASLSDTISAACRADFESGSCERENQS
jgi:hypothetical protein